MAKSLAELKRNAMEQKIEMKLSPVGVWRDGLPERLQGWRKAIGANSNSITLLNGEGHESKLYIDCASLVYYDNNSLTIYNAGLRELTAEEQRIVDGWKAKSSTKDFQERMWADAMTDGSSTYWAEVAYFGKNNAMYLMGTEWERGCKYDYNTGKVYDKKIKGNVQLQYEIRVAQ